MAINREKTNKMQIFSKDEKAVRPTGVQSLMKCNQTFKVQQIRQVGDNEVNCDCNCDCQQ